MAEILSCPACGAADSSVADAEGVHTCTFCDVRYRHQEGLPKVAKTLTQKPFMAARIGIVASLLLLGVSAGLVAARNASTSPTTTASVEPPKNTIASTRPSEEPAPVEAPTSTSLPPAEASATFAFHRTVTVGNSGSAWVLGIVTNTSPYAIEAPRFDIVFLDGSGRELGSSRAYDSGGSLPPAEARPVALVAKLPSGYTSLRVEVSPKKAQWVPEAATGLELTEFPVAENALRGWQLTGKVHNGGSAPARFVRVSIAAWDAAGTLLAVNYGFAAGEEGIEAGADGRYSIAVSSGERPVRFTTRVVGQR